MIVRKYCLQISKEDLLGLKGRKIYNEVKAISKPENTVKAVEVELFIVDTDTADNPQKRYFKGFFPNLKTSIVKSVFSKLGGCFFFQKQSPGGVL